MLYKYKISTTIYCGELEEYERVILSPLQRTSIIKSASKLQDGD